MEIKFTNESGYAQPTHEEKIRRVSFGKFDLFGPRKCPRKNWKQRGHGDFITALKTVSFDEKTGSHSEIQVWGCRINSISWTYLSFSHLHPFSRKKTSPCLFPCLPCLIPSPLSQGLSPVSENPAGPPMGFDSCKCCISCRTARGSKDQQTAAKSSSSQSFSSPVKLWPYMVNVGLFL